jgi:hypothetical protein
MVDRPALTPATVVNVRGAKVRTWTVYIGRAVRGHYKASRWGNPFKIGRDGTRDEVIEKYRAWIVDQPELMRDVATLHGQVLGCWCAPEPCHGEVLAELAAAAWLEKLPGTSGPTCARSTSSRSGAEPHRALDSPAPLL